MALTDIDETARKYGGLLPNDCLVGSLQICQRLVKLVKCPNGLAKDGLVATSETNEARKLLNGWQETTDFVLLFN